MMMPRGKRDLADVRKVVTATIERGIAAWEADYLIMTRGARGSRRRATRANAGAKKTTPNAVRKKAMKQAAPKAARKGSPKKGKVARSKRRSRR